MESHEKRTEGSAGCHSHDPAVRILPSSVPSPSQTQHPDVTHTHVRHQSSDVLISFVLSGCEERSLTMRDLSLSHLCCSSYGATYIFPLEPFAGLAI